MKITKILTKITIYKSFGTRRTFCCALPLHISNMAYLHTDTLHIQFLIFAIRIDYRTKHQDKEHVAHENYLAECVVRKAEM